MMKKVVTLLLAVWLVFLVAACGTHPPDPTEEATAGWIFPEGPAPETEYERAFWYGFAAGDAERDKEAVITEQEMVGLLTRVIAAGGGDVEGWEEMTAGASREAIYRDYGAMLLLYAAERMDATDFTNGYAPYLLGGRSDENWEAFGTDIRGGYPLFE